MRRAPVRRCRRRNRRSEGAQSVLEMAMIFPIMIAIIMHFLAVMIVIEGQNRFQAALSFAAQASVTAPLASPQLSCRYAAQAFWSTVYADPTMATAGTPGCPAGPSAATSFTSNDPGVHNGIMKVTGTMKCLNADVFGHDYLNGVGYPVPPTDPAPPIQCQATANFSFAASPLALFVVWSPTIQSTAEASPTVARQCNPSVAVCV